MQDMIGWEVCSCDVSAVMTDDLGSDASTKGAVMTIEDDLLCKDCGDEISWTVEILSIGEDSGSVMVGDASCDDIIRGVTSHCGVTSILVVMSALGILSDVFNEDEESDCVVFGNLHFLYPA